MGNLPRPYIELAQRLSEVGVRDLGERAEATHELHELLTEGVPPHEAIEEVLDEFLGDEEIEEYRENPSDTLTWLLVAAAGIGALWWWSRSHP